ncbi:hypothetical protein [Rhodobacter sp. CZR27]|uniref:hypothetical protein n=1 Tax=Rhodobacter sp. CZR27 TaxID=2033869 RepID=UPI000BBE087B|nr:hypothetical protein [Rhodobacter sp. CZR27]
MSLGIDDLLTRAGHILWRELPEEYRYRDVPPEPDEPGDLQAFLHGMGHLLDLIRGTTEQLHADSFAEAPTGGRQIQSWILPYLAEIVGADLAAPDPAQRVAELNASVRWFKSKGTLASIDEVGDVVVGAETVAREGWRRVLTCPRPGLPPFTLPPEGAADELAPDGRRRVPHAADPGAHATIPLGCPDFRREDRAVRDPSGANPLYRVSQPRRDANGVETAAEAIFWRPAAPGGVPCFPGAYDDGAARCPDLRDPDRVAVPGPHPRRTLIHVRPPDGLFAEGLKVLTLDAAQLEPGPEGLEVDPRAAFALAGTPLPETAPAPDRVVVRLAADVRVAAGRELRLTGILITGQAGANPVRLIAAPGARILAERSAAERVVLEGFGPDGETGLPRPTLEARDSIFGEIAGGTGFARVEYCTVTGETDVTLLQASDCILGALSSNLACTESAEAGTPASCIRFSRAEAVGECAGSPSNTAALPRFASRWICGTVPEFRPARYGEPGYGVLSTLCPAAIRSGAEDEGEMGAHHHQFLAAELEALRLKLLTFLPLGQEIAIFHDPLLALRPPEALA